MATTGHPIRLADDLTAAALAKGATLGLTNLSACTRTALQEWAGRDPAALTAGRARLETAVAALEAENTRLRGELDAARKALASVKQDYGGSGDRSTRLVAAITRATGEFPATPEGLAEITGYSLSYLHMLLKGLRGAGAVEQPADGEYVPVPGADVGKALLGVRADWSRAVMDREARRKSGAAGRPAEAGAARTVTRKARSATRPPVVAAKQARAAAAVKAARDAGHDVTTASGAPVPVFKAGPDVDCLHENFRGVKGVCPDCKQWVGGKR